MILRCLLARCPQPRLRTLALLLFCAESLWAAEARMLVLDASGSMWGRVDGAIKIDIARDAMRELAKDWPDDTHIGLVVYGHREKGNCDDIELIMPPAPLQRKTLDPAVNPLTPTGKTPLSSAVRKAAEELRFSELKATVVLVSDGKETCGHDPCELGAELEKYGIDFTAHVIGFDVKRRDEQLELRCLAENTGGDYFPSDTAEELEDALRKTAKPATDNTPASDLPDVVLDAPDTVEATSDVTIKLLADAGLDGRLHLFASGSDTPITYQRVQPVASGGYKPIVLRAPAQAGNYTLKLLHVDTGEVLAEKPLTVIANELTLVAADTVLIASTVEVQLTGPADLQGRIDLYDPRSQTSYTYAAVEAAPEGGYAPVLLETPAIAGEYTVRFTDTDGKTQADKPLYVEAADISIDATEVAPMATRVTAGLLAPPGLDGHLSLTQAGRRGALLSQRIQTDADGEYAALTFDLPAIAGDYTWRFTSLANETLAEKPLRVLDATLELNAPARATLGEVVEIIPHAPTGFVGTIHLEDAKRQRMGEAQALTAEGDRFAVVAFKMPKLAGAYAFVVLSTSGDRLLERQIVLND